MAHVAHFPKAVCSWIPTRVLFTVIPELKGGLGAEFPVAICAEGGDPPEMREKIEVRSR